MLASYRLIPDTTAMALFMKKLETGARVNYTTTTLTKSLLIVGLGNPGKEYGHTRHNIGFDCVDDFAAKNNFEAWITKKDLQCELASASLGETKVYLCKPQTFMNLSGEAVQAVAHYYKLLPSQIIVVYDELDIPFGQLRMRVGGSSAGHNGVKSITKHVGEDYGRVRVGIGPKTPEQMDTADFVLGRFTKDQQSDMPALTREVSALLSEYAFGTPMTAETRSFL